MKKLSILYFTFFIFSQTFAIENPSWIADIDSYCSKDEICAVGSAGSLNMAKVDARKNILKYFETHINSSFISSISSDGNTYKEFTQEDLEDLSQGVLKGVKITKTFDDGNNFYALAVLDKKIAVKEIKNDIDKIDSQMQVLLQNNKLSKLEKLYIKRDSINKKYLLLTGTLIPDKISYTDIFNKKIKKVSNLSFYIQASSDFEKQIKNYTNSLLLNDDFTVLDEINNANRIIIINIFKRDITINVKGFIKETYYLNIKTIDSNTKNIISNLYGEFTDTGRNSSQIQDIVKVKMQYFIEKNLNELLR